MQMVTCGSEYSDRSSHGTNPSSSNLDRFHRGMTRPFFAKDRVTDFDMFDRHSAVVISRLKERFSQGEPVDFQVCTSKAYPVVF